MRSSEKEVSVSPRKQRELSHDGLVSRRFLSEKKLRTQVEPVADFEETLLKSQTEILELKEEIRVLRTKLREQEGMHQIHRSQFRANCSLVKKQIKFSFKRSSNCAVQPQLVSSEVKTKGLENESQIPLKVRGNSKPEEPRKSSRSVPLAPEGKSSEKHEIPG